MNWFKSLFSSRPDPVAPPSELLIVEGVESVFHYHLMVPREGRGRPPALCGNTRHMYTAIPLNTWGYRDHLNETYCKECERLARDSGKIH